ncbi:hypothetical protein [Levilactobacillus zymae]|nr:hypothetical protein [Levilactobacillus zymae]MDT6980633.1 hypothetical protein [Levilactobacillus zymae]
MTNVLASFVMKRVGDTVKLVSWPSETAPRPLGVNSGVEMLENGGLKM